MSKQTEELKLALNKAFKLGQRYWSWADSEYSSHWKKADAAKAEFDQLVQDTINAALAEQPAQQQEQSNESAYQRGYLDGMSKRSTQTDWEAVAADQAMTIALLRAEQPAQRTWVGLTDDEIYSVLENLQVMHHRPPTTDSRVIFALAIEAKLKEKNNG